MSSFIWGMIVFPTQRNSQMAGRELRDLLFSPHSSIALLTVLHTDVHLGSAYTLLHFGLSLCNLLQHVRLPYPRWKGTSIALIWGIGVQYKCCIYRDIKCRNFPSDPASYSEARSSMALNSAPPFFKCRRAILISDKGGFIVNWGHWFQIWS